MVFSLIEAGVTVEAGDMSWLGCAFCIVGVNGSGGVAVSMRWRNWWKVVDSNSSTCFFGP